VTAALLVLPGWNDTGRHQYDALHDDLGGWCTRRANLPDCNWPSSLRGAVNRDQTLQQVVRDYDALRLECNASHVLFAALGFSYGGYMAALLTGKRQVDWLILRSPALYPDDDWLTAKEELDKQDLKAYRQGIHGSPTNMALRCCGAFRGHVLLVHSEHDEVIPHTVIESYERAFLHATSITRHTLLGADHELSDPVARRAYHERVVAWLRFLEREGGTANLVITRP
jgi:dipeptidyl aminopeptidase/acylaminoacyl peptidase